MNASEQAAVYLSRQMRTRKQTEEYLAKKGYSRDDIREACDMMEEYHYLDDLEYARLYFETGYRREKGRARIRQELLARGVSREILDEAEDMTDAPDEEETVLAIARKALEGEDLSGADWKQKEKIRARAARKLASRGFRGDIVFRAIRLAESEKENTDD